MKNILAYILIVLLTMTYKILPAQTINWANATGTTKNMAHFNAGIDYGVTYGLGYGYRVNNKLFPVIANVEFSLPSGDKRIDDFKSKIGGQVRWFNYNDFHLSTKIHGVFRRYDNDLVRMANFGSDMTLIAGYYKSRWFVAAESGFDKAIVSHLKHSDTYHDIFPGVVDGWYEPSAGGNFYYGIQGGYTFRSHDFTLKIGQVLTQDFKTKPTIPYYGQIGYNIRF